MYYVTFEVRALVDADSENSAATKIATGVAEIETIDVQGIDFVAITKESD